MIDLHSHTTASDGQHSPEELLRLAAGAGVTVLAVTDHDTVAGLPACEEAARALGLSLVSGIELTAFVHGKEAHLLGHFLDYREPRLAGFSDLLRSEREKRMVQMVEKMRGLGFPVTMEQVRALAKDAHLARPHLARVLVEQRWCESTKEAFDRFLGDGKPAWVDRYRLSGEDAIALIRGAGGTATAAHPGSSKLERYDLSALKEAGLAGLEVLHSDHDPATRERFLGIARELGLVPTAGSDFHGEKVAPGRRLGTVSMERSAFEALRERATAGRP